MEIKLKANLGDTVWYMHKGVPTSYILEEIEIKLKPNESSVYYMTPKEVEGSRTSYSMLKADQIGLTSVEVELNALRRRR